ncbi:MAG: hypothetical protein UU76_C0007G0034 [Parcubacteria group bacterium GW2011_GWC1_41_7]|nr:MAG: hypothetical protein UU76_C0007G0034 [Parcubacteria group bacterium GW2011_GWC1_41_7]
MLTSSIHTVLSSWGFIFSHMGAQEIIDILLTSVLFFGVLFLLTKTKSIPVMMGVAMVVLLYGIALQLHFSLTLRILQSFIGALIVILAIVFQQELRRLFWLIGLLGVKGHRVFLSHKGIDTLTDSLWELAQKKVGALIILPGKESIEQYQKVQCVCTDFKTDRGVEKLWI